MLATTVATSPDMSGPRLSRHRNSQQHAQPDAALRFSVSSHQQPGSLKNFLSRARSSSVVAGLPLI